MLRPVFITPRITITGSKFISATLAVFASVVPETWAQATSGEPSVAVCAQVTTDTADCTLAELLALADEQAAAVRVERATAALAASDVAQAAIRVPANPQLSAGIGPRLSGGAAGVDLELSVQQQLEVFGEQQERRRAAAAVQTEAESAVEETRWLVHVRVHSLFHQVLVAEQQTELAQTFVDQAQNQLRIARTQIAAGETSPLAALVAEAELAQMQESLLQARQATVAALIDLQVATGWTAPQELRVVGALPPVEPAPPADELLSVMESSHPSLHRRRMAQQARQARLSAEQRDARMEPTFGLGWAHEASPGANSGSPSDIVLLQVSIPLPVARRNQSEIVAAQAEVAIADAELDATSLQLRGELMQAVGTLNAAAAGVAVYEESVVPQLQENLSLLQRAYELGEVDIHVVSQTRQRLLAAMSQYLDARAHYYQSAARLEGLVGSEVWNHVSEER